MFEMSEARFEILLLKCKLLRILANGCSKHPSYKAKMRPRTTCEVCARMYQSRKQVESLD